MLDDLYAGDLEAAHNDRQARPLPITPAQRKFSAWLTTTAAPRGAGMAVNEGIASALDAAWSAGVTGLESGVVGDLGRLAGFDPGDDVRADIRQAGQRMRDEGEGATAPQAVEIRDSASRYYMPDPNTSHTAENVVFGLTRFGTKAVGYTLAAGPYGGAALLAGDEGLTASEQLRQQGVDADTRTKIGAVTGGVSAAGVLLPVVGSTIPRTLALTAVGGPGMFIGQQAATRQILQDAGYQHLGDQYDPFDPVGLSVATLVPGLFGAAHVRGLRAAERARSAGETAPAHAEGLPPPVEREPGAAPRPTPEQVDAARVDLLAEHIDRAGLHAADDFRGAGASRTAIAQAIDQMARGDRVNVADVLPPESVQAARLVDMLDGIQAARADLIATAAGRAEPGAIRELHTELQQAQADLASATDATAIKERAKDLQAGADRMSYKQALAQAKQEFADRATDAQARIDRVEQMVHANATAQQAFDTLNVMDREARQIEQQRAGINAPATRETPIAAAAREASQGGPKDGQSSEPAAGPAAGGAGRMDDASGGVGVGGRGVAEPAALDTAAAEPGAPGKPASAGATTNPRAAAVEQGAAPARLAEIAQQFPDLTVQLDGMDAPMPLAEFLAQVQREAMEGTDLTLGGNDAPLMQAAATCFLLNG